MRVIDLDKLTPVENRILNWVAIEVRTDFNRLVESVGLEYENNIDWIVSSIASRNKYLSPLFMRCCFLGLIKRVLETSQDVGKIITLDRALANVLRAYFKGNGINIFVICSENIFGRVKRILTPYYHFFVGCVLFSLRFLGRSRLRRLKNIPSVPITLLDTFVVKSKIGEGGSIYKGEYNDRYYPGLLKNLSEEERKNIFYYPSLIGFINPLEGFKLIRKAKEQFIIPDDFLKISDYLFILLYPIRILRLNILKASFLGFDVTPILRQEKTLKSSNLSSLFALLNYRFAFRLSQEKLSVRLLVEWHENQVIDRGMIVGFRRFHPKTRILGYQGYIVSKNLHIYIYPTPQEYRSQAVPHRIGVVGKGLLKDIQEFCHDFDAVVVPAFRFNKVWEKRKRWPEVGVFTMLIALPIGLKGSQDVLDLVRSTFKEFGTTGFRFWIKPHPTLLPKQITSMLDGAFSEVLQVKTGDFNECVEGANLLIGNASSTCLEALAKGIPAIVVGDRNGIIENPIPDNISNIMWRICSSEEELISAVRLFQSQRETAFNKYQEISEQVKKDYFEPVTSEGVRRFLEIGSSV